MKLMDFIAQEEIREDLSDMTGDPKVDFLDTEEDINEEIMEALEAYETMIESSLKGDGQGISLETLNAVKIGVGLIAKQKKDELYHLSNEDHESLYISTVNTLSEIKRLKGA